MSTATGVLLDALAEVRAEAEVITRAQSVLARYDSDGFAFTWNGGAPAAETARGLRDCLETHAALLDGSTHPATVFPDLGRGQYNALEIALRRVTEDIADWTGGLVITVGERCGDEAAAYLRGTEGGES